MSLCFFFFLFLIFLFWIVIFLKNIVSITYSLIIYLFWNFWSFNIWICVSFGNIWNIWIFDLFYCWFTTNLLFQRFVPSFLFLSLFGTLAITAAFLAALMWRRLLNSVFNHFYSQKIKKLWERRRKLEYEARKSTSGRLDWIKEDYIIEWSLQKKGIERY